MGGVPTPKRSLDGSKPWGQHLRGDSSGIPPSRMLRGLQWGTPHAPRGRGRPSPKRTKHRGRGGSQAARGSAGGLAAFPFETETPSGVSIISIFVSTPQFWQFSPGSWGGGGGRNTFFSTIFNLLLFIKLSSSFGGLKQTWTESGKTNSSEARRRLSLANWLLAALWKLHVLRAHGGGPSSCAMGGVGGAPLETPRHSGQRDPRAVPSEMLAPWFGPIQGALGCGVPPSQAFPGAATGTADSVALLLGHGSWNQPA